MTLIGMKKQGENGMKPQIFFSRENAHLLAEEVFKVVSGISNPVFPHASKGMPSRYVLLGELAIDTDQYHQCVLPVIEKEDLQVLRTPRSREFMKDRTRTQMFIDRIGGYLTDSFTEKGY